MSDTATLDKKYSFLVYMLCGYIFLFIERPWESIRYLHGIRIEFYYALFMLLIAIINGKFVFKFAATNVWVYGFVLLHFVLSPFAYYPDVAFDQSFEYTKLVVLYILMISVIDDGDSFKFILTAFAFSVIIYVMHSYNEYLNGRYISRMGISRMIGVDSTFNDPNSFASGIVVTMPIIYALYKHEYRTLVKLLYKVFFILGPLCVIQTGSRSGFVVLLLSIFIWGVTREGKSKFRFMIISVLLVVLTWQLMPNEKRNRIRTIWDEDAGPANAQTSTEGRKMGFQAGMKMLLDRPLTGVGPGGGNFIGYRIDRIQDGSNLQSHNLYGQILSSFGIGGGLLFIGLIWSTFSSCLRVKSSVSKDSFYYTLCNSIALSVFLLLVFGLGGHNFYRPYWLWFAAWSSLSMQLSCSNVKGSCVVQA